MLSEIDAGANTGPQAYSPTARAPGISIPGAKATPNPPLPTIRGIELVPTSAATESTRLTTNPTGLVQPARDNCQFIRQILKVEKQRPRQKPIRSIRQFRFAFLRYN